MKIAGEKPGLNSAPFTLRRADGREWIVTLQALPYGFPERNQREIPDPVPPVVIARDSRNRVLRDETDRAITYADRNNAEYQAGCRHAAELRALHAAVVALRSDPSVTFDANRESFASASAWMEAVAREFADAGITDAEIGGMLEILGGLNSGRAREARVDRAAEDFLRDTLAGSVGSSPPAQAEPPST